MPVCELRNANSTSYLVSTLVLNSTNQTIENKGFFTILHYLVLVVSWIKCLRSIEKDYKRNNATGSFY
jgi:hypothetical protein